MNEWFDNSRPNVIFISDITETYGLTKSYGPYKVAYELRQAGFEVFVLHHAHVFAPEEIFDILSGLVSDQTLFIGFNPMFYREIRQFDYSIAEPRDRDMVLSHSMSRMNGAMLPHGHQYNQQLKAHVHGINPRVKFVLGGPLAHDSDFNRDYDYVIPGYADLSIVWLAQHLSQGISLPKRQRSIWGPTIIDDRRAESYDFVNSTMSYRPYDGVLPGESLPIEVSRGCIFHCAFCSYPLNGKNKLDYIKRHDLLYREMVENYERYGITRYYLLDDTFNDSREKVQYMLDLSRALPFELEYWAYLRLDLIVAHRDQMDMIYESGCRATHFGIESLNKRTGSAIGKSADRERITAGLQELRHRWPKTMLSASLIAGLPHETQESLEQTIEWLRSSENPLDSYAMPAFYLYRGYNLYPSKIELNPEKYGYRNIRPCEDNPNVLYWENDHMDFYRACELSDKANFGVVRRPTSNQVWTFMGLGYNDLQQFRVPYDQLPWDDIVSRKWRMARQYKDIVWQQARQQR